MFSDEHPVGCCRIEVQTSGQPGPATVEFDGLAFAGNQNSDKKQKRELDRKTKALEKQTR